MRTIGVFLLLAVLSVAPFAKAATDAVDPVPAATLLVPYFEVNYSQPNADRPVFTVGNNGSVDTLAHVTLWTDRGVPTYSFDMRIAANGIQRVDLFALFSAGVVPQTTAGAFGSCAASLPPQNLSGTTLTQLQRAHRGVSSTLLGGNCGGVNYGQPVARGYVTIDATRSCTTKVPGDAGYFINGGLGIATNDNVLWGEMYVSGITSASGTPLVHIEASATDDRTDGVAGYCPDHTTCPPSTPNTIPDYTFYRLRTGNADDNREGLPQHWRGRYDISASATRPFTHTFATVWRDPGKVNAFPCGAPPAGLPMGEVLGFDDRENPSVDANMDFPYATQQVEIAPSVLVPAGATRGFVHYSFTGTADPVLGTRRQGFVTHIIEGTQIAGAATAWPLLPISSENAPVYIDNSFKPPCSDGIDNDGDGKIDFPADPGCRAANSFVENPACSDGIDNDGDGNADYPADAQCYSAHDWEESDNFVCDDGIDNDGDGKIDWPADAGCTFFADSTEDTNACSDGVDNDGDGLVDMNDPGCASPFATTEAPQCNDGIDNDGDGFADMNDPGCASPGSNTETPQCNNGIDDDGDNLNDFPNDPGCANAASNNERPQCNDGIDNDGDGFVDLADAGCTSASDTNEFQTQCNDGIDNDGDGFIDFPNETGCASPFDDTEAADCSNGEDDDCDGLSDATDPGCSSPNDLNEGPGLGRACSDGIDNDGDGRIDYPADPGCSSRYDDVEYDENAIVAPAAADVPALSPLALAVLAALLAGVAAIALRGSVSNG